MNACIHSINNITALGFRRWMSPKIVRILLENGAADGADVERRPADQGADRICRAVG